MFTGLFALLAIAVQIGLIVHVFRTGRPIYWAFILFFFPLIGSLAYFFIELLPDLQGNPRARNAMRGLRQTIDPGGGVRRLEKQHQLAGSIDSARHLANELIANGRFEEAISHYEGALTGMYEHDPDLLLGLAGAQFGNNAFADSKATLERLTAENPDFKSAEGHLLYARASRNAEMSVTRWTNTRPSARISPAPKHAAATQACSNPGPDGGSAGALQGHHRQRRRRTAALPAGAKNLDQPGAGRYQTPGFLTAQRLTGSRLRHHFFCRRS